MGTTSAIEWTEATWNPLVGCTKVSPGCDHCYAETLVNRFAGKNSGFPNRFDVVTIRGEKMLTQPLRWRQPKRIFVNSLSDLFHDDVPDEFIARVFAVMALAQRHTFQLLTKRHARMRSLLSSQAFWSAVGPHMSAIVGAPTQIDRARFLPNVWLGVSVENQQWADIRIPALLDTPAAVRWISAEPLLGPVDLFGKPNLGCDETGPAVTHEGNSYRVDYGTGTEYDCMHEVGIDWVVCGGESGPGARPMHPDWARSIRDQCVAAGVPFLFKQHGNWAPVQREDDWRNCRETDHHVRADGYHWPLSEPHGAEDGTEVLMRNVGKKAAGRLLDGREWSEYPAVVSP